MCSQLYIVVSFSAILVYDFGFAFWLVASVLLVHQPKKKHLLGQFYLFLLAQRSITFHECMSGFVDGQFSGNTICWRNERKALFSLLKETRHMSANCL